MTQTSPSALTDGWRAARAELDVAHVLIVERGALPVAVALHVLFALRHVLATAEVTKLPELESLVGCIRGSNVGLREAEKRELSGVVERMVPACVAYAAGEHVVPALAFADVQLAFKWTHRCVVRLSLAATRTTRIRRYKLISVGALALLVAGAAAWRVLAPKPAFYGRYYAGMEMQGEPMVRADSRVDFDWLGGSPMAGLSKDTFSARWDTCLRLNDADTLEFRVGSDDGSRVFVDDKLLINNWRDQAGEWGSAAIKLAAGVHAVRVDYFERGGDAMVVFKVTRSSGGVVEDGAFEPPQVSAGEARCAP